MEQRAFKADSIVIKGLIIDVSLVFLKLFTGIVGHSTAIIADAFDSLSDSISDIALLWGFKLARKPIDKCHAYGHGKTETVLTTLFGFVLMFVAYRIFIKGATSIYGVFQGVALVRPGAIALAMAGFSIILKVFLSHRFVKLGREIDSKALLAKGCDYRGDVVTAFCILLGVGGAMFLGESWRILDPLAAIILSFFILKTGFNIFFENANELIEASLDSKTESEILSLVETVEGAYSPHNLKTRKIGKEIAIDLHVRVDPKLNIVQGHDISSHIESKIKERFGPGTFVIIHIEPMK